MATMNRVAEDCPSNDQKKEDHPESRPALSCSKSSSSLLLKSSTSRCDGGLSWADVHDEEGEDFFVRSDDLGRCREEAEECAGGMRASMNMSLITSPHNHHHYPHSAGPGGTCSADFLRRREEIFGTVNHSMAARPGRPSGLSSSSSSQHHHQAVIVSAAAAERGRRPNSFSRSSCRGGGEKERRRDGASISTRKPQSFVYGPGNLSSHNNSVSNSSVVMPSMVNSSHTLTYNNTSSSNSSNIGGAVSSAYYYNTSGSRLGVGGGAAKSTTSPDPSRLLRGSLQPKTHKPGGTKKPTRRRKEEIPSDEWQEVRGTKRSACPQKMAELAGKMDADYYNPRRTERLDMWDSDKEPESKDGQEGRTDSHRRHPHHLHSSDDDDDDDDNDDDDTSGRSENRKTTISSSSLETSEVSDNSERDNTADEDQREEEEEMEKENRGLEDESNSALTARSEQVRTTRNVTDNPKEKQKAIASALSHNTAALPQTLSFEPIKTFKGPMSKKQRQQAKLEELEALTEMLSEFAIPECTSSDSTAASISQAQAIVTVPENQSDGSSTSGSSSSTSDSCDPSSSSTSSSSSSSSSANSTSNTTSSSSSGNNNNTNSSCSSSKTKKAKKPKANKSTLVDGMNDETEVATSPAPLPAAAAAAVDVSSSSSSTTSVTTERPQSALSGGDVVTAKLQSIGNRAKQKGKRTGTESIIAAVALEAKKKKEAEAAKKKDKKASYQFFKNKN